MTSGLAYLHHKLTHMIEHVRQNVSDKCDQMRRSRSRNSSHLANTPRGRVESVEGGECGVNAITSVSLTLLRRGPLK